MTLPQPNDFHEIFYVYVGGAKVKLQAAPVFLPLPWWKRWMAVRCQHINQQVYDRAERHANYQFNGETHTPIRRFTGIVCLDCGDVLKEHQYE